MGISILKINKPFNEGFPHPESQLLNINQHIQVLVLSVKLAQAATGQRHQERVRWEKGRGGVKPEGAGAEVFFCPPALPTPGCRATSPLIEDESSTSALSQSPWEPHYSQQDLGGSLLGGGGVRFGESFPPQ